jgi:hypothetical protein
MNGVSTVQTLEFNTAKASPRERFELYRYGLCQAFAHLTPQPLGPSDQFEANMKVWQTEQAAITMM